jgi:hypothetical protein
MPPSSDIVPSTHSFFALVSVNVLFIGFILLPAIFPQPNTNDEYTGCIEYAEYWDCSENYAEPHPETIHLPPFFYLSALACSTGILGCLCLWWKHQKNYEWLIKRIFLPALCNSVAGLLSTLVIANAAEEDQYSRAMRVAMVAPSAGSVVAAAVGLGYYAVMLWLVKREHEGKPVVLEKGKQKRQNADS